MKQTLSNTEEYLSFIVIVLNAICAAVAYTLWFVFAQVNIIYCNHAFSIAMKIFFGATYILYGVDVMFITLCIVRIIKTREKKLL